MNQYRMAAFESSMRYGFLQNTPQAANPHLGKLAEDKKNIALSAYEAWRKILPTVTEWLKVRI